MLKLGIASGDRVSAQRAKDGKAHWGGAGWVRLGQYEPLLDFNVVIGTLTWNRTHFSISDAENRLNDVDIIYIQRLMHDTLAEHIKKARAQGQVIINDLDDWYWGLSPSNAAFMSAHPKVNPHENINHYKSVLNASDTITVSTPYLRDRLRSMLSNCPPIELIENTVDTSRFTNRSSSDTNRPVVGWVGSTNHRSGDLETLRGTLAPLYRDQLIYLQHSGHSDGAPTFADAVGVTESDVKLVHACDPELYPSILTMDIGIAPLKDTPFNHAKSDIKLLEYSASGIPWVASDLPSYSSLQKLWGHGRIAKKNRPIEWQKHIKALCDPKVRGEEGLALRESVKSRDILVGARVLNDFLHALV